MAGFIHRGRIVKFDNCGHSPVWPLLPQAMSEIEASGFGFAPAQPPMWNDPCLAVRHERNPMEFIGFLIYRYDDIGCAWFILLAHVLPDHRRKGVHSALFHALVERASKRGDILSITSGTHIDNHAAQAAFLAQGRTKTAIMYKYQVREWLDGEPYLETPGDKP